MATTKTGHPILKVLAQNSHLLMPAAVICIIVVMIVPMPSLMLDMLVTLDITLSVIILMVSMYIEQPVNFSVFPSLLLIVTLFRLSLNIAASRLILLHGSEGVTAAGRVIQSFGQFVIGGNYVIGIVMFLVLLAIQYIVVNHGATRIAEVTARFTLDSLPGKQMSIDAELNSGLINETEARQRRKLLQRDDSVRQTLHVAIRPLGGSIIEQERGAVSAGEVLLQRENLPPVSERSLRSSSLSHWACRCSSSRHE